MITRSTRGSGFFEGLLSKKRSKIAKENILKRFLRGRILDLGCGTFPCFLSTLGSFEKYGIDQADVQDIDGIKLFKVDLNTAEKLPFEDGFFDVVSALALIEHLDPSAVPKMLREAKRVLNGKGVLIITTPADWTDSILKFLAAFNLISKQEISEHKSLFNGESIRALLSEAGFRNVEIGSFEFGMNILATAGK